MLPHHPGSTQPAFPPQAFVGTASNVSAATFPDYPDASASMVPQPHLPNKSNQGPASGALSDLLGLESELTNIQVGSVLLLTLNCFLNRESLSFIRLGFGK